MRKFTVYPKNYVGASSRIMSENALKKFDPIRKLLGEKEWYYIEEYLINGDKKYSLKDILYDEEDVEKLAEEMRVELESYKPESQWLASFISARMEKRMRDV